MTMLVFVIMFVIMVVVVVVMVLVAMVLVAVVLVMIVTVAFMVPVRSMGAMIVLHQTGGPPSQRQAQQQGHRQGDSIVPMELQLGQQIAQGDAEDHAGSKGDGRRLDLGSATEPRPTDHRTGGGHQGVGDVHPVSHRTGSTICGEQRTQGEGIERLVEHDRQQQPHSCDAETILETGRCSPEGQPREQTVDAESDQSPEPRRRMGMRAGIILVRRGMMMEADEPLEQEHGEESEQHPGTQHGNLIVKMAPIAHPDDQGVRKQMEDGDPQHDAGYETERDLHSPMGESHEQRKQSPDQGDHEEGGQGEDECGRHVGRISAGVLSLPAILILALACTATVLPWGRGRLPILMYHKVRPGPADGLTVPLAVFREQMKTLSQAGYESISFADLTAHHRHGTPLPGRPILLTFDDAYADYEIHAAPVMQEHDFTATMFVPVGCVGRENSWDGGGEPLMDWNDLRRSAERGTELALHSFDHRNYRNMSLEEIRSDLTRSIAAFDAQSVPYRKVLAYPYGGFPRTEPDRSRMKQLLRELDIEYAARIGYRIERTTPGDRYELRRVGIDAADRGLRFRVKLTLGRTRL